MATPESKIIVTKPTSEPVTLDEAKYQLRLLENTDFDVLIDSLIISARQTAENYTRQYFVRQKWRLYFNCFHDVMNLSPAKVRDVEALQYIDTDGATQTAAASLYTLDISGQKVTRAHSQVWPSVRSVVNAVWLDVWVGMYDETASPVDTSADIEAPVKQAILMLVGSMFEQTENDVVGAIVAKPNVNVDYLLRPYWMPNG